MPSTTAVTTGGLALPLELLGAPLAALGAVGVAAARAAATAKASTSSSTKAGGAAKPTTSKTTTSKTTAKKASTTTAKKATTAKASGYATKLPADYAFLRDPKLSIEEKLSRFIGMLMTKSEQDLLAQMEKMAPGSTAGAAGTSSSTSGAAPKPAAKKFSIWSLAKTILPPLGLASQLVGDAALKKLVQQLSGPVLAAAATALGGPALGALASQVGPSIGDLITRDVKVDLSGLASLVGLDAGTTAAAKAAGATSTAASGAATKASGADGTSEKAQLMELQRLQDRDKELFTLFSNMLKSMHDARMTSIQNIR